MHVYVHRSYAHSGEIRSRTAPGRSLDQQQERGSGGPPGPRARTVMDAVSSQRVFSGTRVLDPMQG